MFPVWRRYNNIIHNILHNSLKNSYEFNSIMTQRYKDRILAFKHLNLMSNKYWFITMVVYDLHFSSIDVVINLNLPFNVLFFPSLVEPTFLQIPLKTIERQ